jgi:hypothetical protein
MAKLVGSGSSLTSADSFTAMMKTELINYDVDNYFNHCNKLA